jgi:ABC-type Co2+ transport system permease subunit
MILSQRGSCSPHSLRRRRGEVRVIEVGVVGVVFGVGVGVVLILVLLVLLLRVLLLGAPWRTIIRRPIVVRGNVLLKGLVGWQVILARRRAAWKLDGAVQHFLCKLEEKGTMDEEGEWF